MVTRSFRRSSVAMTPAHADQHAAFKKCCLRSGRYDGANRNHFFPRGLAGGHLARSALLRLRKVMRQKGRIKEKAHLSPALSPLLRRAEREKKRSAFFSLLF